MNGVSIGFQGRFDYCADVEVALRRIGRPDSNGATCLLDVWRVGITVREHGDGLYTQPSRSAFDAACDFPTVGNQETGEHVRLAHILNMPNRGGAMGALVAAASPKPSTIRVSTGSITPSSHNRALA